MVGLCPFYRWAGKRHRDSSAPGWIKRTYFTDSKNEAWKENMNCSRLQISWPHLLLNRGM